MNFSNLRQTREILTHSWQRALFCEADIISCQNPQRLSPQLLYNGPYQTVARVLPRPFLAHNTDIPDSCSTAHSCTVPVIARSHSPLLRNNNAIATIKKEINLICKRTKVNICQQHDANARRRWQIKLSASLVSSRRLFRGQSLAL